MDLTLPACSLTPSRIIRSEERPTALDTAPPFLTYSELGGLPQDPLCGAQSCPRSQEVAEGEACKVLDLLSIYGFRGDVELMVGLAVQPRVLGGPSPLAIVLTVVAD